MPTLLVTIQPRHGGGVHEFSPEDNERIEFEVASGDLVLRRYYINGIPPYIGKIFRVFAQGVWCDIEVID